MPHRTPVHTRAVVGAVVGITALILAGCGTRTLDPIQPSSTAHSPGGPATAAAAASPSELHHQGGVTTGSGGHQGGVITGDTARARVKRVVDGDTIVAITGGEKLRVRILGIDTPETVDPDKPVECFGPEASAFAHDTLGGQTVTLRTDPTQQDTDRYGRALRYVELADGQNYSIMAAAGGYARPYVYHHNPVRAAGKIAAAADEARSAGRGLWGSCN